MVDHKILFVIPARGGSKGIPKKNIKLLDGKPLIVYALEVARKFTSDENICISTDDEEIISVVGSYGYEVPFRRPPILASDTAGTYEVLIHAIEFYETKGLSFDTLVLLQPTSPFRNYRHIQEAMELYSTSLDMVVSVKESHANPYLTIVEENEEGLLQKSKPSNFTRRQDAPKVYEYNGAVYVINVQSLKNSPINKFTKVKKYVMDELHSIDLDTPMDWAYCEFLIQNKYV